MASLMVIWCSNNVFISFYYFTDFKFYIKIRNGSILKFNRFLLIRNIILFSRFKIFNVQYCYERINGYCDTTCRI